MSTPRASQTPTVDVVEAMALLTGDALMIDVRDQHEWSAGHPPHAVHIPIQDISASTAFTTRTRRVIVVSRSGRRAASAVSHLRTAGVDAATLHGGLHAWVRAGGEIIADAGREPKII